MNALIYQVNAGVSFISGLVLNFLLFGLFFLKSLKEMKIYSKILLQTAVIDIILLTVNSTVIPVIYIESVKQSFFNMAFGDSNNMNIYLMCSAITGFSQYALPVQFIHRYLVVCRWIFFGSQ
uniref:G-protein coupled receptors family 1 profile domain-containing protein n=1 Tax=Ditylenchus dipsaci TaxID=166011 RepID=A0A915DRN9_9BILA